jgi:hypothetical protein
MNESGKVITKKSLNAKEDDEIVEGMNSGFCHFCE